MNRRKDDSQLAGIARTPQSANGMNRTELEALASRMGWTPRELSMADIRTMSSAELRYHEVCNSEKFQAAFERDANVRENKKNMAVWDARRMWRGAPTADEDQKARAAGEQFATQYPQFIRSNANAQAMVTYMREHDLDGTQVHSYITAFEALAMEGRLSVSPKAAGVGGESEISGNALTTNPRFHLLLQATKTLKPEEKLSADEWFAQHPELRDNRIPPVIAARKQKLELTAAHFQKANDASSVGNVVQITDYKSNTPPRK